MNQAIISRPPMARYRYQCRYRQEGSILSRNRPSNSPHGKEADPCTSPRCWTRYWRYAAIPTGTGCWRSSSTDRKNTVIHTLIHTIMFFTAINQMMTEGVDLTLVIRKANGQLAVSVLPKSNGLKDEAQNHIIAGPQGTPPGTGCRIPASRRPAGAESHGADHQHGAVRGAGGESRR